MRNLLLDCGKPIFFQVASLPPFSPASSANSPGDTVRVMAQSLDGMQKEALTFSTRSHQAWRLASDEGAYLAGLDAAPCPLSFLTVGMVCSTLHELQALAAQRRLSLHRIRLVQDNYYTMTGSALRGTMRGGAGDVRLTAQIESDATAGELQQLVQDAVAASPVNGLLADALTSRFALAHNGQHIAVRDVEPLAAAPQPDPLDWFERAHPAAGDWSGLIRRGAMTPRSAHTVTLAGDSLAPEQNRLLHVRGICTLRDDGMKQIEALLFNPHGSIFHFLCDEARDGGKPGRAPDALSYASAGIAFCFMTQFGRYAAIAHKNLRACRIVQDAHFSLGGASGGSGLRGTAAPIETHVHLLSAEPDAEAQQMLAMAEQTCFLHALCKASLKTRVSIATALGDLPDPSHDAQSRTS